MEYEYAVTAVNDRDYSNVWSQRFDNALEAVNVFNKFNDFGDAESYRTINLAEPNGKMHTKVFYRNGNVGGK
jgi:hypothetical protein